MDSPYECINAILSRNPFSFPPFFSACVGDHFKSQNEGSFSPFLFEISILFCFLLITFPLFPPYFTVTRWHFFWRIINSIEGIQRESTLDTITIRKFCSFVMHSFSPLTDPKFPGLLNPPPPFKAPPTLYLGRNVKDPREGCLMFWAEPLSLRERLRFGGVTVCVRWSGAGLLRMNRALARRFLSAIDAARRVIFRRCSCIPLVLCYV